MANVKKKRRKWWIIMAVITVLVVGVIVIYSSVQSSMASLTANTTKTAEVTVGDISKTVVGTGTLAEADTQTLTLEAGLKINSIGIEAGDTVKQGEVIATLDEKAIDDRITTLRSDIESVDKKLSRLNGDTVSSSIEATVDGRVKQIFVEEGDDVAQAISEYGALMILSTDGKMKAVFTPAADGIAVGSKVNVQLSDGKLETGTVESLTGNKCVVTLTDNGPEAGDQVKILSKENGTLYGDGVLEINKPLAIIASGGTVTDIRKGLNQKVNEGNTLIEIDNEPYSNDYETQYNLRKQKVAELQTMLNYQQNPVVTAPCDGIVKDVLCEEGETLTTDKTAFRFATGGITKLTVAIDELDLRWIEVGQKAEVTLDAIPGQSFGAEITDVAEMGDAQNGITTFDVTLTLQSGGQLKAGMNATATITVESRENVLLLPMEAISEDSEGQYVYVNPETNADGRLSPAEKRMIETGLSDGIIVEITEGLMSGDQVIYTVNESDETDNAEMPVGGGMMGRFSGQ